MVPNGVGTDPLGSLVRSRGSLELNLGFGGRWGGLGVAGLIFEKYGKFTTLHKLVLAVNLRNYY